jgi:membrane-associated protease RseP (regulator of RpoE activity)
MKHCPECNSRFPDTDKFCELDGTPLVIDASPQSREVSLPENWKTLAIVAVAGIAIGIILFVIYQRFTREDSEPSSNESSNQTVLQQQAPLAPSLPGPVVAPSPTVEPSPSPSATPSPVAQAEPTRVALSSSPVTTTGSAANRRGLVTIRLIDGTDVEADEVWETAEGIWYRRRGIVTLLQRDRVKAIDKTPTPSPTPVATPSPSPSPSP